MKDNATKQEVHEAVADDGTVTLTAKGASPDDVDGLATMAARLAELEAEEARLLSEIEYLNARIDELTPPAPTGKHKTIVQKLHSEDAIAAADAEIERMEDAGYRIAHEALGGPMQRVIRFERIDAEAVKPSPVATAADALPDEAVITEAVEIARGTYAEASAPLPIRGDAVPGNVSIIGTADGPDALPDYLKNNFAAFFLTRILPDTDLTPEQGAFISRAWSRWESAVRLSEVAS